MKNKIIKSTTCTLGIVVMLMSCNPSAEKNTTDVINSNESNEAKQLFSGVKTRLNADEKNQVAVLTGLSLNQTTGKFESEGEEVDVQLMPLDIDHDKNEDLFVITYSMFLYGNTGQGFNLLMKNENGKYHSVLSLPGIPGLIYKQGNIMPDIQVGGPGFDFPIYSWKNNSYQLDRGYQLTGKVSSLDDLCRTYASNLN